MKHLIFLLVATLLISPCKGQELAVGQLNARDFELLRQIENESNPEKVHELVIELILLSDDKSALPLLEEAKRVLEISRKKKDPYLECLALSLYGQGNRITGNFAKALQYHYKALELSKSLKDNSLTGFALNQSGHIYKDREENDKAVAIYKQASYYANLGPVSIFKFYPIMNLGFVYLNAGKPDSALYYSSDALQMLEEILGKEIPENKIIIERSLYLYCLSNLAGAYSQKNDKGNADKNYARGNRIIEKYRGYKTRYLQFYYYNLARHYQRFNLADSMLYAAKIGIGSVSNTPFEYLSAAPARMISDYYEHRNADSTVKYLRIYLKGNEVMNSTRVTQQLQAMSFEDEQRSIEIQRAEKAYRERIILYLLVGGLLSLLFVAIYMYRSVQQRKKINDELKKQKSQVEETLTELKATQAQLIQSEKMASLGELTAGIAHEIQNPLNFVNNFSEVNVELIDELQQELKAGKTDDALTLSKNIKENEEKINHHGKRADSIVKGMLQHSRSSSNVKELTDINALCDEYLRLSYHGLRAKDKSFNAATKTDFDPTLGTIKIIPQDIGRVILNLLTNAFYAVTESKKQKGADFEPVVSISTKNSGNRIEIRIKDNGIGIPQSVKEKIFQPFFTTKPTGQGTGLGLSLSYDIVKAHGGKIDVNSEPGLGSEFIITLIR